MPEPSERSRAYALILAAGRSRRFGDSKLHAVYRGRPLLSHVLDAVATAVEGDLLEGGYCVIGEGDDRARMLTERVGVPPLANGAPDLGVSHSLQLGLAALEAVAPEPAGAAVILLGDQPLVRVEVIEALIHAWKRGSGPIVRPCYMARPGIPGHPALLDRSIWPHVRRLKGDRGLGSLLESRRHEISTIQVSGDNPDVDTQADLSALEESSR